MVLERLPSRGNKEGFFAVKGFIQLYIEKGEYKEPGQMALKILKFEVIGEGKIGIPNPTYSDKLCEKCEVA